MHRILEILPPTLLITLYGKRESLTMKLLVDKSKFQIDTSEKSVDTFTCLGIFKTERHFHCACCQHLSLSGTIKFLLITTIKRY